MGNQNWNQFGEDIKDIVQQAIHTQDFSQLNESISDTVRQATEQLGKGIQNVASAIPNGNGQRRPQAFSSTVAGPRRESIRFTDQWARPPVPKGPKTLTPVRAPYIKTTGLKTRAYAKLLVGGVCTGGFGLGLLSVLLVQIAGGLAFAEGLPAIGVLGAFTAFGLTLFCKGNSSLAFLKRFQKYVRMLGDRSYYELKELAQRTGKSLGFIRKDIRKMLEKGMFPEGRLDDQETCLIVTNEAYQLYQDARMRCLEREQIEQKKEEAPKEEAPSEIQRILDEGNGYLEKIRACNERIPGEEISGKISRMELLVQTIFERLKEHPEAADELEKMMSYYLPTTVRLLEAYGDMDLQPVQGENITSAKKEIEDTLDTLNVAFGKLLDAIFRDTAWDVSTDISVLHTLLAQEGLTEEDFKKPAPHLEL